MVSLDTIVCFLLAYCPTLLPWTMFVQTTWLCCLQAISVSVLTNRSAGTVQWPAKLHYEIVGKDQIACIYVK